MTTVLIGWELGGGLGHIMRAAGLAHAFVEHGCRVVVALADLAECDRVSWPHGTMLLAAPHPRRQPLAPTDASTFGELLYCSGYHDVHQVTGLITAWANLLELCGADVLLADHSPSALLAAKVCGIPAGRIGSGFFAPPPGTYTPSYRDWEITDSRRAHVLEQRVLEIINQTAAAAELDRYTNLAQALTPDLELISSWPEFDCYLPLRKAGSARYLGNEYAGSGGCSPCWPADRHRERPRVVAYLKSTYEAMPQVLGILAGKTEVLAFISGLNPEQRHSLTQDHVQVTSTAVALEQAAEQADLLICHAGAGTAQWFLAAGKPVLLLPYSAEQLSNARCIESSGAGKLLMAGSVVEQLADLVLLMTPANSDARKCASALARKWADQPDAFTTAAARTLALIGG